MISPLADALEDLEHCPPWRLREMLLTVAALLDDFPPPYDDRLAGAIRKALGSEEAPTYPGTEDHYRYVRTCVLAWQLG